ncbi:hypothetical protein [Bacillus sp. NEB1478]|uniref:hypothetical protein n=1 Tax=Bacillus sp. NEB1478 TaxID=3073816 RepID=UPI0028735166|nr:hypothetical protein [Bacillus sp. NEB1478]WNB91117.1 hypothetical protein RGB74_14565 [Bacillus sp. NEB1478]
MEYIITMLAGATFLLFFLFYAIHIYAPNKKKIKYFFVIVFLITGSIGAIYSFLLIPDLLTSVVSLCLVALAASSFLIAFSMDMFMK